MKKVTTSIYLKEIEVFFPSIVTLGSYQGNTKRKHEFVTRLSKEGENFKKVLRAFNKAIGKPIDLGVGDLSKNVQFSALLDDKTSIFTNSDKFLAIREASGEALSDEDKKWAGTIKVKIKAEPWIRGEVKRPYSLVSGASAKEKVFYDAFKEASLEKESIWASPFIGDVVCDFDVIPVGNGTYRCDMTFKVIRWIEKWFPQGVFLTEAEFEPLIDRIFNPSEEEL